MAFRIDPYAWIYSFPLALGLVSLYFRPAGCAMKRLWSDVARAEADMWFRLTGVPPREDPAKPTAFERSLYWFLIGGLSLGSGISLASFLG